MTMQPATLNPEVIGRAAGLVAQPTEVLFNAKVAARALADVLEQKVKKIIMGGEQYLEYEDWQLLGQFYGYTVATHDAVPIEIFGVKGAKATADLIEIRTGIILGHAEAYCMRDEEKWNTRPKYEWRDNAEGGREKFLVGDEPVPWYQLGSMAQTRAGAKAFRNRLAWVVVLAGYKATPAEELMEDMERRPASASVATGPSAEHWCSEHKTAFFKRGKMKSYGHPLYDEKGNETGEWCHEHVNDKPAEAKTEAKAESKPEAPVDLKKLTFKNAGEFYTACLKYLKLQKSTVDPEIAMYDMTKADQRAAAWDTVLAVYGPKPPETAAPDSPTG